MPYGTLGQERVNTEIRDFEPSSKLDTAKKVAVSTMGRLEWVSLVARCQIIPFIVSFWFCVPPCSHFERRFSSLRASNVGSVAFATASGVDSLWT